MSSTKWQRIITETVHEIQQRIPNGPVFTLQAITLLVEQIGIALENRRLNMSQVRFVTAVEGLKAVEIAQETQTRMINDSIMKAAFLENHLPGEEPWECMAHLVQNKPTLLRERAGLDQFA